MSTTPTTHPVKPEHPVIPEDLMALLDGELPADHAQSISAHAGSCDACIKLLQESRRTRHAIAAWSISPAPESLNTGVEDAAARFFSTSQTYNPSVLRTGRPWPRKKWAIGLGLCAALLLLGFFVTDRGFRSSAHSQAIARKQVEQYQPLFERLELAQPSIRKLPGSKSRPIDGRSVDGLLALDSALAGSNGKLRGQGDHIQNSFSSDGQPLSDQQESEKLQLYAKLEHVPESTQTGPMIARTVSLAMVVKDFDVSRRSLDAILVRHNGYSANLTVNTPQGASRSLNASLRIPAPQLAAALAELKALGHVENESQNGEEVTQQHADLVARLKNSRETEQRLQAILTQRTGKISDVLEVEQEIARVRGEIEEMEAEQKNLEHRVDFATIDLQLGEEYKVKLDSGVPSFSTRFHNALVNGYRNVADTLVALVLFCAEYGPILVFWVLLLGLPAWLVWRRWRQTAVAL
jgi:hypothetical protein